MSVANPLFETEDWRGWKVAGELEYPEETPRRLTLPDMVKCASALIRDVPLEKIAAPAGVTLQNIWRHVDAHPYVLVLLLVEKYGVECLTWKPGLLRIRMGRDGLIPSNSGWTKILAGRCVFASDLAWNDWQTFHWVSLGLAGKPPNFGLLEEPEITHIILAAELMRAAFPDKEPHEEIQKYIAAVLRNDSLIYAPYPIEFCQDELDNAQLECSNCGAKQRDDGDRVCVTCHKESLKTVPHPLAKELETVKRLWAEVKDMPLETAVDYLPDDTYEGNSVYRMLTYWDAARDARKALAEQLTLIRDT